MRVFYSELATHPAYYAFGYSVYGELEEGDKMEEVYARGFVPFVGARTQPERMTYMVRSVRVRVQEFKRIHYHHYAESKAAAFSADLVCTEYERHEVPNIDEVTAFMLSYFHYRFGKASMSRERLTALLASPLLTHIVLYHLKGELVGCVLETRAKGMTHLWYYGYSQAYEKKCLGLHIFTAFIERSKERGDTYAYLGSTYGSWMRYKAYYRPLEYWNGEVWVDDAKGTELKRLLAADPIRHTAFTDRWREARSPYYPSPYPYTSLRYEVRYLTHLMYATPRVFGVLLIFLSVLALSVVVNLWVR
jgi:arginine-tRNA-protein transferase